MSAFEALVDQAPDGVVILEAGRVVYINATAAHLLGVPRDQAVGRPIASFLPAADAALAGQRIGRLMATGEEVTPADYGTLADPSRVVEIKAKRWEWQGRPAVLAFARDVTERKAMAQQLVHADRLAAIGTLAAGVAHEVNNPLAYVQLSLSLIEEQLRVIPSVPTVINELLRDASDGVDRVAAIVRSLRAFVRPSAKDGSAATTPTDLTAAVETALRMVDNDLRHRGQLVRAFRPIPTVLAHPARLEQVLVNLLLNAIQALTGRDTDTITVTLEPHGTAEVAVTVRDTGTGMTPEVRARMFDPFFTTRPIGEGMGLGLAVSKSLVEAMGGRIAVDSEPGRGTSMTIVLRAAPSAERAAVPGDPAPCAGSATSASSPTSASTSMAASATPTSASTGVTAASASAASTASAAARRRVLIIDDEPLVRTLLAELLAPHHDIEMVASGRAAVTALQAGEFDVVLCDVMMPGMSGVDVYCQLATSHPGLERRFVFITGGAFTAELETFLAHCGNEVIAKPFQLSAVLAAIERVGS